MRTTWLALGILGVLARGQHQDLWFQGDEQEVQRGFNTDVYGKFTRGIKVMYPKYYESGQHSPAENGNDDIDNVLCWRLTKSGMAGPPYIPSTESGEINSYWEPVWPLPTKTVSWTYYQSPQEKCQYQYPGHTDCENKYSASGKFGCPVISSHSETTGKVFDVDRTPQAVHIGSGKHSRGYRGCTWKRTGDSMRIPFSTDGIDSEFTGVGGEWQFAVMECGKATATMGRANTADQVNGRYLKWNWGPFSPSNESPISFGHGECGKPVFNGGSKSCKGSSYTPPHISHNQNRLGG